MIEKERIRKKWKRENERKRENEENDERVRECGGKMKERANGKTNELEIMENNEKDGLGGGLMAYQTLWVIQCQSHPCRRTVVVLYNS